MLVAMSLIRISNLDRPSILAALMTQGFLVDADDSKVTLIQADLHLYGCSADAAITASAIDEFRHDPAALFAVLSGPRNEASLIAALEAGADDAISAESNDALIVARIVAMLRRQPIRPEIVIGSLRIDPLDRQVARAGQPISLLPREYQLLLELARRPGEAICRSDLLLLVCGQRIDPGTNVLQVHISRLRAKLDRGFDAPMLLTERGKGYRLVAA